MLGKSLLFQLPGVPSEGARLSMFPRRVPCHTPFPFGSTVAFGSHGDRGGGRGAKGEGGAIPGAQQSSGEVPYQKISSSRYPNHSSLICSPGPRGQNLILLSQLNLWCRDEQ